jgi:hypothetical protein
MYTIPVGQNPSGAVSVLSCWLDQNFNAIVDYECSTQTRDL